MTAYDVVEIVGTCFLVLAAFPANYIVYKYHKELPWRSTEVGKSFMFKALAIAAILDLSIMRQLFGDSLVFVMIRVAVFLFFVYALYRQAFLLREVIREAKTASAAVRAAKVAEEGAL